MSDKFDWYTDEDQSAWEEPRDAPLATSPRRRRWPILLAVLLALALTGYAVMREVNQRIAESQDLVEAEVLAANELVQRAAANSDRELLISMLSGRDAGWTETQTELLEVGLLFGEAVSPIGLQPLAEEPISATVTLSSNFREAVVNERREFTANVGNDPDEAVLLDQSLVFRKGERNWLLAPPQDDFWGDWVSIAGDRASFAYSLRDERFAGRFAVDIESKLAALCVLYLCPANWRMSIRFDREPESLLRLASPEERLKATRSLDLPSPTLIGMPVDETGTEALSDGYAALVIAAALADILEWKCCLKIAYFEAIVDATLAELGVRPYPLRESEYLGLVNYPVRDGSRTYAAWDARSMDDLDPRDRALAHAIVEYLLSDGAELTRLAEYLVAVGDSRGSNSLLYWARLVTGSSFNEESWYQFVREKAESYQNATPPPIPLPDQDLLLACRSRSGPEAGLYRYDIATNSLSLEVSLPEEFFFPLALPDDSGVFLTVSLPDGMSAETQLIRSGVQPARVLWNSPGAVIIYLGEPVDPQGQYAQLWVIDDQNPGPGIAFADLTTCAPGADCWLIPLPGAPVWSPDGQLLIVEQDDGSLLLGDRGLADWQPIGEGHAPFWISEELYGFIGLDYSSIYLSRVSTGEQWLLLAAHDLAAAQSRGRQPIPPMIQMVKTHPAAPDTLFVLAAHAEFGYLTLFRVTLPPGEAIEGAELYSLEMTWLIDGLSFDLPQPIQLLSPDGNWLAAKTAQAGFQLLNLDTGQTYSIGIPGEEFALVQHDWSADSPWIAFVGGENVELIAPLPDGELVRRIVFQDDLLCSSVNWVNSLP